MCSEPSLYLKYNKLENQMPAEKCYNGFSKNCNKYNIKQINNNFEIEDVKKALVQREPLRNTEISVNLSQALNTMPPPPPHSVINNNKSMLPLSYNRRGYWKSNCTNGRSLSPLGYDSDESCKSYGSKGNIREEHGKPKYIYFFIFEVFS